MSKGLSEVSKWANASEAGSVEQVDKWAVRANQQTDERVAKDFSLYFGCFGPQCGMNTIVRSVCFH